MDRRRQVVAYTAGFAGVLAKLPLNSASGRPQHQELRPATILADAHRISDGSGREGQEHLICIASLAPVYNAYVSLCCLRLH